jgi:serine protease Do
VAAILADSRQVEVGDWILAVGHPFGLGLTVTAGIVGRRRGVLTVPGSRQYTDLFQTDAPINEGSSGGPLVDLAGQVVGINMAIYAPTGVFSGAGFAIPSNRVRDFVSQHLGGAQVAGARRAYFGIQLAELTQALSTQIGYQGAGVVVQAVAPGSPAALAQLTPGDVVTHVAQKAVPDLRALGAVLAQFGPGDAVPMQVWRGGRWQAHTLRLNANVGAG